MVYTVAVCGQVQRFESLERASEYVRGLGRACEAGKARYDEAKMAVGLALVQMRGQLAYGRWMPWYRGLGLNRNTTRAAMKVAALCGDDGVLDPARVVESQRTFEREHGASRLTTANPLELSTYDLEVLVGARAVPQRSLPRDGGSTGITARAQQFLPRMVRGGDSEDPLAVVAPGGGGGGGDDEDDEGFDGPAALDENCDEEDVFGGDDEDDDGVEFPLAVPPAGTGSAHDAGASEGATPSAIPFGPGAGGPAPALSSRGAGGEQRGLSEVYEALAMDGEAIAAAARRGDIETVYGLAEHVAQRARAAMRTPQRGGA